MNLKTQSISSKHINQNSSEQKEDPYAGSITTTEFMKQIRAIQQSNEKRDINLRSAADHYMNNLHCV